MIVSCCDSRVEPEAIFSALPGELFVVRNVANLVPPYETSGKYHGVSSALELAVLNLRVRHMVVIGHSSCGGIRACLDHDAARESEAHFITNWMSVLAGAADEVRRRLSGKPAGVLHAALEREGIKASRSNLRTFPFIKTLESKGQLALHGAHFDIGTGTLTVLNEATGEFIPVSVLSQCRRCDALVAPPAAQAPAGQAAATQVSTAP